MKTYPDTVLNNQALTTSTFWNNNWQEIQLTRLKEVAKSQRQRELIAWLQKMPETDNRKILEVGVGSGILLYEIAQALAFEPFGLDLSEAGCVLAQKNAQINDIKAHIVGGDIFYPPFAPGHFQMVFNQGVIEHFIEPLQVLRPMARLVANNGYLITTVPNIAGFYGKWLSTFPVNGMRYISQSDCMV